MYNITRFISDSHIGIGTTDGKCDTIIPPLYKRVVILRPGLYLAMNDDNKWGILNDKNQVVISFEFEYIEPLEFGNYFAAKKNDSLSLFSLSGQLVSGEEFEKLESLGPGLFLFAKHGLYGALDKNGHIILPCDFESIRLVCHGRFLIASCHGQVRCFKRGGEEILLKPRSDFEACKSNDDGYLRTTEKGLRGLAYAVDEDFCIEIIPCQYHSISERNLGSGHEPVITLKRDFGFKDNYLLVSTMSDGTLLYGFIDWENNIRVPLVYEDAEAFGSFSYFDFRTLDFTSVKLNEKWGIIDRQGKWLTLPRWDSVEVINHHGLCIVRQNNKYGVYKVTGEEVLSCSYDPDCMIKPFFTVGKTQLDEKLSGAFLFEVAGKVGLYSKRGKTLIEPNYSDIQYAGEGICAVCRDNKWGYYDLMNGEVVSCQFEHVEAFSSGLSCVYSEYNDALWKWKYLVDSFNYPHEKSAVVDRDGNIKLKADRIIRISEHLFWLENDNYGGIVNSQGETLYEYPGPIPEGNRQFSLMVESERCFIGDNKGLWKIDFWGECVIGAKQLLYVKEGVPVLEFKNGLAVINVGGEKRYMDVDGNMAPIS
jgi:hypothetical protein